MFDFDIRGPITVIGHDISDVDSLVSCLLLKKYLCYFGFEAKTAIFTQPMNGSVKMLAAVGAHFSDEVRSPRNDEQLFLVDHHETPSYGDGLLFSRGSLPSRLDP